MGLVWGVRRTIRYTVLRATLKSSAISVVFNVLPIVAGFESDLIRARTREGMQVTKAKGRLRGKQQNSPGATPTLIPFKGRTHTAVKLPAVRVTGTPSISGTAKTGSTLKVSSPGKWTAGTKLTYQWMRNGAVKGAAAASYKLAVADKGTTITVKVTGTKTGHTPASAVSKKTAAVR